MSNLTVLVLFGGCSSEHDISIKSAIEISRGIDNERYNVIYVGITRWGEWRLCTRPALDWESMGGLSVTLPSDRSVGALLVNSSAGYQKIPVDVVFPVLHGTGGEDGSIQGLLELAGIPYVGCDVQSSVVCMDKALAYTVASDAGITVPRWRVVYSGGRLPEDLSYPVIVKPARSGSSFGVCKVEGPQDLQSAITSAQTFDDKVIIEELIVGRELGCAILGNGTELMLSEIDEVIPSSGLFKVHLESNPESGSAEAQITVPAPVPSGLRERVQQRAREIYITLGCVGLARVDMFVTGSGEVILNEVNTMPGFTSYSRYPRMMASSGYDISLLCDRLIELALQRAQR